MLSLPVKVTIEDETLRDGLQIEKKLLGTSEKIAFIKAIEQCGVRRIQIGSFVHPERVPQMADTDILFKELERAPDVLYSALILNMRGLERAVACRVPHLSISVSASETHSRKNAGKSIDQAVKDMEEIIASAKQAGIQVRAGIQSAFGCGFEGPVSSDVVRDIAAVYGSLGVAEINLADTTGMANPRAIQAMIAKVRQVAPSDIVLSLHLHDTRGLGLANMMAGLDMGITLFDTALGGLGGCPFIPKAAGNIATEDAVYALAEMGVETGIDWQALCKVAAQLEQRFDRQLPGRMMHIAADRPVR